MIKWFFPSVLLCCLACTLHAAGEHQEPVWRTVEVRNVGSFEAPEDLIDIKPLYSWIAYDIGSEEDFRFASPKLLEIVKSLPGPGEGFVYGRDALMFVTKDYGKQPFDVRPEREFYIIISIEDISVTPINGKTMATVGPKVLEALEETMRLDNTEDLREAMGDSVKLVFSPGKVVERHGVPVFETSYSYHPEFLKAPVDVDVFCFMNGGWRITIEIFCSRIPDFQWYGDKKRLIDSLRFATPQQDGQAR